MTRIVTREFFLFALVGVTNTAIHFLTYTIFVFYQTPYLLANVIGYAVGMINSYFLNKHFVFQNNDRHPTLFMKFLVVNILTVAVHSLLLYCFVSVFAFHKIYSQAIVTMITLLLNFAGNKLWTFK